MFTAPAEQAPQLDAVPPPPAPPQPPATNAAPDCVNPPPPPAYDVSGPRIVFGAPAPPSSDPDEIVKLLAIVTALPAAVAPPPPEKPIEAPACGPIEPVKVIVPPGLP